MVKRKEVGTEFTLGHSPRLTGLSPNLGILIRQVKGASKAPSVAALIAIDVPVLVADA